MKGKGLHQGCVSRTDEWLTPPEVLKNLGQFDLDPCSPVDRPWDTALQHYTILDNGLILPWHGRVWLNPPYGKGMERWMAKMAGHRNGLALVFARTDTQTFHQHVFPVADSLFFIESRIRFCNIGGMRSFNGGGAPSVLIAYGEENVDVLEDCGLRGRHVYLNSVPMIVVALHDTWKAVVTVALTRIGGEAPLARVYEVVERIAPQRVTKNKHYREKIRQTLQAYFPKVRRGTYTIEL